MADDPHRDLLPVKDGGCHLNTGRSSVMDQRERHSVCKLDRYQLEDRYLRLLDEVQDLKKLSNIQEDKIKRLATKLMRVAATPRSCLPPTIDLNHQNRVEYLEHENAKLHDKITVLKNQILNHKIGRSRSRSRRLQIYPSSDPATSRSEIGRIKSSSSHLTHDLEDEKDERNNLLRIEELEIQKKQMNSRIAELESQLENQQAEKQREKTAENVEIIRVWRQMKQQSEQLSAAQALNVSLTEQTRELTQQLDDKTKTIKEVTGALMAEKERFAELDEQLGKAKSSQLSIREKDEQIKDLISEMKILRQHNNELIAITAKYSQVEQENIELKKTIAEHLSDHRTLKSAFSNEQANMTALQAANEQLIKKLHDFQRNIDSLTIQLKTFQSQNERQERSEPEIRILRTVDRETSTDQLPEKLIKTSEKDSDRELVMCKNCSLASRQSPKSQWENMVNREVQTEDDSSKNFRDNRRDEVVNKSPKRVTPRSPMRSDRAFQPDNDSVSLLPEEMLKLLEQAQINMPPEMKDSARIKQIASTMSRDYLNLAEPSQSRAYGIKYPGLKNLENCLTRKRHLYNKISDTSDCKCSDGDMCSEKVDCGNSCTRSIVKQEVLGSDDKFERHGNFVRNPFRNVVSDISASRQKTCDDIRTSRRVRADGTLGECYKSWQTSDGVKNSRRGLSNDKDCIVCKKAQRNFSGEQTEQPVVKKSREDEAGKNSHSKQIPNNDLPCIRCCDDCRSGESLNKIESFPNSSNTQEESLSGSSKLGTSDAKRINTIENDSSILSAEFFLPRKGAPIKTPQVDVRNSVDKGISSVLEDQLVHGRTKNSESRRESLADSYISTSMEHSDTSVIPEMEDEDSTSDTSNEENERRISSSKEKQINKVRTGSNEDTDKADTDSVKEFNSLIRNNIILSPRDSCSSVQDLGAVFSDDKWHEYKRRSIDGQAKPSGPSVATTDEKSATSHLHADSSYRGNNTIIIRIESLSLDKKCSLLEDDEVHQLYVEFSFLGYHGADLETISVPKPTANTPAFFNYMRKFEIDEDQHQMQRSIMRAMMADDDNPTVKFTVVSEPLPEDMETKECVEVGYAFLNVRDHILSGGSHEVPLTIVNLTQTEPIGVLKITLLGVEVIRRCMSDSV